MSGRPGPGACFEDFVPGETIETMRRTIVEADMLAFVQLTGLFEELWLDAGRAEATGLYRGRLVPGYLTMTFAEGLFVLAGWNRNAVGMLGITDLRWTAPVVCGDTIRAQIDVVQARLTSSPERGVVQLRHRVLNQEDAQVLTYESARLIRARGEARAR